MLSIDGTSKTYDSGVVALQPITLAIEKGEIFALLGPNGAGKTTLISIVCGTVRPSGGTILLDGQDLARNYRQARGRIGLVPQELALDIFASVWGTVKFSRGLFGKARDDAYLEKLLRDLALWDKKDAKIIQLSGGMKRRVMIAKALSHEPDVLFLDEPTAGVDVGLRRDMWTLVRRLREQGVTIILTTHYIEEAEEMADRVGVIDRGQLLLVERTEVLMRRLGKRRLALQLAVPMADVPEALAEWNLQLADGGKRLVYEFDANAESRMGGLLRRLGELGIEYSDLETSRSSLEDIFVGLVERP